MFSKNLSVAAFAAPLVITVHELPQPPVVVADINMPRCVLELNSNIECEQFSEEKAVSLYNLLRKDFALSNTAMSKWLGVKRRTLYNWINEPLKSRQYGQQIESRLSALSALREEMEPEHRPFLHKVAFSPIYGNPVFGELILSGASENELIHFYDEMFAQFESYKNLNASISDMT